MPNSQLRRKADVFRHRSCKRSGTETLLLFRRLRNQDLLPNRFILPSALLSASNLSLSNTGRSIHSFAIRYLLLPDLFISSALIYFYFKRCRTDDARRVFDRTPDKDLVVWNSMISGYACCGLLEEAASLLGKMQSCGPKPDILTWNPLIYGFAQSGFEHKALEFFNSMRSSGIEPDDVSWTSLISGAIRNFNYGKAFDLFRRMFVIARVRPSAATISSLLPASANVMDLRRGREIHGFSIVAGFDGDVFVGSSLVDMYAKCGLLFDAEKVFDHMTVRNTVSWNSMIFAFANHGRCERAIQLFYQMETEGATPDHLTYTAVLSACSHAGMVQLGNRLFLLMQESRHITPRLEHYACMVDLLGRAGKLLEAYELIRRMPMEPDFFVWGALLGACRLHGEAKLSKIAAGHLRELEPKSGASFLLMSNILVNAGRWRDAEKMKQLAKRRKLRRYRGCSWTHHASFTM